MKKLYVVMLLAMASCGVSLSYASDNSSRVIRQLEQTKNSITRVILGEFAATPEALTENGRRLIELSQDRIDLLDKGIQAVKDESLTKSYQLKHNYSTIGNQISLLEERLEFFKNYRS